MAETGWKPPSYSSGADSWDGRSFEDSLYEVCKNLDIMDEIVVSVLQNCYKKLFERLQQIANQSK